MQKIVLSKGIGTPKDLQSEIESYINVLLGHEGSPIEEGVEKFITWYKEYYNVN